MRVAPASRWIEKEERAGVWRLGKACMHAGTCQAAVVFKKHRVKMSMLDASRQGIAVHARVVGRVRKEEEGWRRQEGKSGVKACSGKGQSTTKANEQNVNTPKCPTTQTTKAKCQNVSYHCHAVSQQPK